MPCAQRGGAGRRELVSSSAGCGTRSLGARGVSATIVAGLGYVSLRQWETAADQLFREQARDVAAMATEKVEMMLRHAEDAFLDRLQVLLSGVGVADRPPDELVPQSRLAPAPSNFDP